MLYAGYGKNYAAEGEKIMPKVSVIVPVYNAEKYLQECVDSILGQTLADLELILVDDGSTDTSPALCDWYAEQDARVKVIHKPNGRAASARNAGLRAASGEYVAFVDSDDWVSAEMYEKMLGTGADVTLCDYVRFRGEKEFPFTQPNVAAGFNNKAQIREKIYPHLVMDGIEYPITISNCVMLIKRDVLVQNKLSYREDIHISEDAPFGSEVLYCANSFAYMKGEHFYHYRMTEESASKTYQPWWWDSYLKINEETENFFSKCEDYDFTQQIKSNMFYLARAEIYYILCNSALTRREQNRKVKAVMDHPRVVRMMEGFDVSPYPIQFKMLYWSIRYRSIGLRRLVSVLSNVRNGVRK